MNSDVKMDTVGDHSPVETDTAAPMQDGPTVQRPLLRRALFALGIVAALAIAGYLFLVSGRYESTDNAYVKADIVNVSAEVSGKISTVEVRENQPVVAGDVLLRIDARPYVVVLHDAEARLQEARLTVESLKAMYEQNLSELAGARDDLAFARKQHQRVLDLRKQGAVSQSEVDRSQLALDAAGNSVREFEGKVAETRARLAGQPDIAVEEHPAWLAAYADYESAQLDLERTTVRAPIDGVASKVPITGGYVTPGLPVMTVVGNQYTWIVANFKEDQLAGLTPGDPAEVAIDSYPSQAWRGSVESIGQATGAEFALLPAQNATGNWVKVVQRIPVRIRLQHHDDDPILRSGMSAVVTVDTGRPQRLSALADWLGVQADRSDVADIAGR